MDYPIETVKLPSKDLPVVCNMIRSYWIHNRSHCVMDILKNAPLLTRSYSSYGYKVHMGDVHLLKIVLDMLFKLPFTPRTVNELYKIYNEHLHHTFLPLFMHLYILIPRDLITTIRDQVPPNASYDNMITFLNTPFSQSIVITSITNRHIKRILEQYSQSDIKDLYSLLDVFDCTLGVNLQVFH